MIKRDRDRPASRPPWIRPPLSVHWNFPDCGDFRRFVNIFTFTNAERVELYRNDELLAKQRSAAYEGRLMEWYVPYEPGILCTLLNRCRYGRHDVRRLLAPV